jgi:UPF0716 protein FxsA
MRYSSIMILVLPILELIIFIEVGSVIGSLYVVLSIFITMFLGYYLIKQKLRKIGLSIFDISNVRDVYEHYTSSMYSLFGGVLLIIPGYLTDFVGLAVMLPIFRPRLSNYFDSKYGRKPTNNKIIEGDYRDND